MLSERQMRMSQLRSHEATVWTWRDAEWERRTELSQGRLGEALAAILRDLNAGSHPSVKYVARESSLSHRRQMRFESWIELRMTRWREANPPPTLNVAVKDLELMADVCQRAHQYDGWGKDCSFDLQGLFHTGGITGEEHERERWWVDRLHQILERAQLLETVVPGLCDDPLLDEQGVSEAQSGVSRVGRWAKRIGAALAIEVVTTSGAKTRGPGDQGPAKTADSESSRDWLTVREAAKLLVEADVVDGLNLKLARGRVNSQCRTSSKPKGRIRVKKTPAGKPRLVSLADVYKYILELREKNLGESDF